MPAMTDDAPLEPLADGLYAGPSSPIPFMTGVVVRSFVLDTDDGPVVVYNTPGIGSAANSIRDLGKPARLLINHYHEAMFAAPDLDIPTLIHERDRVPAEKSLNIDQTINSRITLGDGLEAIPSLAHTPGATLYLWDNGTNRFLFPGDSFWVENGRWRAVILEESDRGAFLDTLHLMQDLDFDVLVPWPAEQHKPALNIVSADDKQRQLDDLISRVRGGSSGPSV